MTPAQEAEFAARLKFHLENDMPLDFPSEPRRPERSEIHPDTIGIRVEKWLGRPLTRAEYTGLWNAIVDAGRGGTRERIDQWVDVEQSADRVPS